MATINVRVCDKCRQPDNEQNRVHRVTVVGASLELCHEDRVRILAFAGVDEGLANNYVDQYDLRFGNKGPALSLAKLAKGEVPPLPAEKATDDHPDVPVETLDEASDGAHDAREPVATGGRRGKATAK